MTGRLLSFEVPVVNRAPVNPQMATSNNSKQRASASYSCARLPCRQDVPEDNPILGMRDAAIPGITLSTNSTRSVRPL